MVVLGPVLFAGFEVPERIVLGGRQRLAVHTLLGAGRLIDALGPDDADIAWSGVIAGPDAGARVRLLDGLRRGGSAWPLAWDGWRFTVVVKRFAAEMRGLSWVPYRIVCAVLCEGELPVTEDDLAGVPAAGVPDAGLVARAASGLGSASFAEAADAAGVLARAYRAVP